ncbi:MAG: hypothetical protein WC785_10005 [Tatlockia sp.]|jgi:hypothetical protein
MSIISISILIPSLNQKMNDKYMALNLDAYSAPFLEKSVISSQLFSGLADYNLYFCELKKFLSLNYLYVDEQFSMVNKQIDSLWHQFILFTREYQDFCNCYFGKFIHHSPNLPENDPKIDLSKEKKHAEKFFQLYFMTFGQPATLWFYDEF